MANLNSSILNGHNQNVQDVNKINAVEVSNTASSKLESTFADVHVGKNTPVQAMLDKHLEK